MERNRHFPRPRTSPVPQQEAWLFFSRLARLLAPGSAEAEEWGRVPGSGGGDSWRRRLSPLSGRLLVFGEGVCALPAFREVVAGLNRPAVRLVLVDGEDGFPDFVTTVVLAPVARPASRDGEAEAWPGLSRLSDAYGLLLACLRPGGLLIPWSPRASAALLACAAVRAGVPLLVWFPAGAEVPPGWPSSVPVVVDAGDAGVVLRRVRDVLPRASLSALHIGCGANVLADWQNVDISPVEGAEYIDASRPFPFPDDTFELVFSEHMFEHLEYDAGCAMLAEVFRVLKPGGVLRLTTPRFEFLRDLYADPGRPAHARYLCWSLATYAPSISAGQWPAASQALFVANLFLRSWGHRMVYDRPTLSALLRRVGFRELEYPPVGESRHPRLRGVERHGQAIPEWANRLESMTVEARKPADTLHPQTSKTKCP